MNKKFVLYGECHSLDKLSGKLPVQQKRYESGALDWFGSTAEMLASCQLFCGNKNNKIKFSPPSEKPTRGEKVVNV